jgi:hypothetical protein
MPRNKLLAEFKNLKSFAKARVDPVYILPQVFLWKTCLVDVKVETFSLNASKESLRLIQYLIQEF